MAGVEGDVDDDDAVESRTSPVTECDRRPILLAHGEGLDAIREREEPSYEANTYSTWSGCSAFRPLLFLLEGTTCSLRP
jgi:hypothetical protein